MPGFDALAPEQKAVLQLLLKQGKSYAEIAELLRSQPDAVRERALDALDVLGADAPELAPERQDEVADHLLGQQTDEQRTATRAFLAESAPGREWATVVADQLRPIGGDAVPALSDEAPAVPDEAPAVAAPPLDASPAPAAVAPVVPTADADDDAVSDAHEELHADRDSDRPRASRRGGLLLLGLVALIIAGGVWLVVGGGDDDEPTAGADRAAATQPAACALPTGVTSLAGATGATGALGTTSLRTQQVNLLPPEGSTSKARGYALVTEGGLALQAEGLSEDSYGYKVWLWNSETEALPLGFAIYDKASKRYAGAVPSLPKAADGCGALVLTRERAGAETPGTVVLAGTVKR